MKRSIVIVALFSVAFSQFIRNDLVSQDLSAESSRRKRPYLTPGVEPRSGRYYEEQRRPIFLDNNSSTNRKRDRQCIVTGRYNNICTDMENLPRFNRQGSRNSGKFRNVYKCYKHAKCGFVNGKCRFLKTTKFKKCLNRLNQYRGYHQ